MESSGRVSYLAVSLVVAGFTGIACALTGMGIAESLGLAALALAAMWGTIVAGATVTAVTCIEGLEPCFPRFLAVTGLLQVLCSLAIAIVTGRVPPALPLATHGTFMLVLATAAKRTGRPQ